MDDKLHISLLSKETDGELLGYFAHLLPQDMTGISSDWEFVGAFYDDIPCGILAYIMDDEIIIPWIYVDEEYRRRSIGSQMLEALRMDLDNRILFTGFSCEITLGQGDSGLDLFDFFANMDDLYIMPKYCIYEVSADVYRKTLAEHPMFKGNQAVTAKRFVELTDRQKRDFTNIDRVADCYQIDDMKKWSEKIDEDLSLCIMEDNKVVSAILVANIDEGRISIELLYSSSTNALVKLLMAFGNELSKEDTGKALTFCAVNDKILELAEELFSEISVCAEVWEVSSF